MGAGQGKDLKWGKRRKDMAKSESQMIIKFTERDGGINTQIEGEHISPMMCNAAILALTKTMSTSLGCGSLDETVQAVVNSLNDFLNDEEPISRPKSLKEAMRLRVLIETDGEGRMLMKLVGADEWLYSALVAGLIRVAENKGEPISKLQERVNASLRFVAVERGEVKKTLEDRATELRVSFIKKLLEEAGDVKE